eukprot:3871_1
MTRSRIMLLLLTYSLILIQICFAATTVSIDGTNFKINGAITYSSSSNSNVKGLMFNSRMVQGIFDDYNQSTVHRWVYPDTKKWDPDRNVKEFVGNMSLWHENKLLSFTVGLQGGCPYGYCSSQPWIVSAYDFKTGALDTKYFNRLNQILSKADSIGMVPIVQLFYFGQVGRFNHNNNAIYAAINNTMQWLLTSKYRGILIEVVNEVNEGYSNTILDTANIAKTISYVKQITNNIFPVGTSYGGGGIPSDAVVEASDVIFLHGNGQSPGGITNMINKVHSMQSYKNKPKPIVFNEDDHYNFNSSSNNMKSAVDGHASWGYFDGCSSNTADDYHDGYQCPATSWAIDTNRKAAFFEKVDYYATT